MQHCFIAKLENNAFSFDLFREVQVWFAVRATQPAGQSECPSRHRSGNQLAEQARAFGIKLLFEADITVIRWLSSISRFAPLP